MVVRRIRKPMRRSKIDYSECVQKYTKKYATRKAPPYPANKCCKTERLGNDGNFYASVPTKKGTCVWKLSGIEMKIVKGKSSHKSVRKSVRKGSRKGVRKSVRKGVRKRKVSRRGSRKASRKRKRVRKRKVSRRGSRKASRKR